MGRERVQEWYLQSGMRYHLQQVEDTSSTGQGKERGHQVRVRAKQGVRAPAKLPKVYYKAPPSQQRNKMAEGRLPLSRGRGPSPLGKWRIEGGERRLKVSVTAAGLD